MWGGAPEPEPAGPVDTSEQTNNERTDPRGTAGCLMLRLQRFSPAGKKP